MFPYRWRCSQRQRARMRELFRDERTRTTRGNENTLHILQYSLSEFNLLATRLPSLLARALTRANKERSARTQGEGLA